MLDLKPSRKPALPGGMTFYCTNAYRYTKFSSSRRMQPPPSAHRHIYLGYLVVRKVGTPEQYETWMPDHVFDELYEANDKP